MNYHNITKEDMNNGDGLRTVLWVAGCEHHCPGCQNPVTWDGQGGLPFDADAENELMEALAPDYISGITFSGGDPLATYNRKVVLDLIEKIREKYPEKTIWVYTGFTLKQLHNAGLTDRWIGQITDRILKNIDVLVDGRYCEDLRDISLKWRGSSNQRVIDVPGTLKTGQIVLHCE